MSCNRLIVDTFHYFHFSFYISLSFATNMIFLTCTFNIILMKNITAILLKYALYISYQQILSKLIISNSFMEDQIYVKYYLSFISCPVIKYHKRKTCSFLNCSNVFDGSLKNSSIYLVLRLIDFYGMYLMSRML